MKKQIIISQAGTNAIKNFISTLQTEEDLSEKTLKDYASDLRHFIDWYESSMGYEENIVFKVEDIAIPTITRYRDVCQREIQLKPATINRRLNTLKRFFEWQLQQGHINRDPSKPVKLLQEVTISPRQMTDREEEALVAAVEREGSLRDQTIIIVMLHTGLRTMEICDLRPSDIQLGKRTGQLIVRAGKRNKQREVPLNSTCRATLEKYLALKPSELVYLFSSEKTGGRLMERSLRSRIEKYMKAARIEGLSAHDLRHRFGYVMIQNTPIHRLAQIMGHDNLNTTMIYTKATKADLQREVEKIAWE